MSDENEEAEIGLDFETLKNDEKFKSLDPKLQELILSTKVEMKPKTLDILSKVDKKEVEQLKERVGKGFSKDVAVKIFISKIIKNASKGVKNVQSREEDEKERQKKFAEISNQKKNAVKKMAELTIVDNVLHELLTKIFEIESQPEGIKMGGEKKSCSQKIHQIKELRDKWKELMKKQKHVENDWKKIMDSTEERTIRIFKKREERDWKELNFFFEEFMKLIKEAEKMRSNEFLEEMRFLIENKEKAANEKYREKEFYNNIEKINLLFDFIKESSIYLRLKLKELEISKTEIEKYINMNKDNMIETIKIIIAYEYKLCESEEEKILDILGDFKDFSKRIEELRKDRYIIMKEIKIEKIKKFEKLEKVKYYSLLNTKITLQSEITKINGLYDLQKRSKIIRKFFENFNIYKQFFMKKVVLSDMKIRKLIHKRKVIEELDLDGVEMQIKIVKAKSYWKQIECLNTFKKNIKETILKIQGIEREVLEYWEKNKEKKEALQIKLFEDYDKQMKMESNKVNEIIQFEKLIEIEEEKKKNVDLEEDEEDEKKKEEEVQKKNENDDDHEEGGEEVDLEKEEKNIEEKKKEKNIEEKVEDDKTKEEVNNMINGMVIPQLEVRKKKKNIDDKNFEPLIQVPNENGELIDVKQQKRDEIQDKINVLIMQKNAIRINTLTLSNEGLQIKKEFDDNALECLKFFLTKMNECDDVFRAHFSTSEMEYMKQERRIFLTFLNESNFNKSEKEKRINMVKSFVSKFSIISFSLIDIIDRMDFDFSSLCEIIKIIEEEVKSGLITKELNELLTEKMDEIVTEKSKLQMNMRKISRFQELNNYMKDIALFFCHVDSITDLSTYKNLHKENIKKIHEFEEAIPSIIEVFNDYIELSTQIENKSSFMYELQSAKRSLQYVEGKRDLLIFESLKLQTQLSFIGANMDIEYFTSKEKDSMLKERNRIVFKQKRFDKIIEEEKKYKEAFKRLKWHILRMIVQSEESNSIKEGLRNQFNVHFEEFENCSADYLEEINKYRGNISVKEEKIKIKSELKYFFINEEFKLLTAHLKNIDESLLKIENLDEKRALLMKRKFYFNRIIQCKRFDPRKQSKSTSTSSKTQYKRHNKLAFQIITIIEYFTDYFEKDKDIINVMNDLKKMEKEIFVKSDYMEKLINGKVLEISKMNNIIRNENSLQKDIIISELKRDCYHRELSALKELIKSLQIISNATKNTRRNYDLNISSKKDMIIQHRKDLMNAQHEMSIKIKKEEEEIKKKENEYAYIKAFELMKEEKHELDMDSPFIESDEYACYSFHVTHLLQKKKIIMVQKVKKQQITIIPDFYSKELRIINAKYNVIERADPDHILTIEKFDIEPKRLKLQIYNEKKSTSTFYNLLCNSNKEREILYSLICTFRPFYSFSNLLTNKKIKGVRRFITTLTGFVSPIKQRTKMNQFIMKSTSEGERMNSKSNLNPKEKKKEGPRGMFKMKIISYPTEEVFIWCGNWNVERTRFPKDYKELNKAIPFERNYDIYALGVQESFYIKSKTLKEFFMDVFDHAVKQRETKKNFIVLRVEALPNGLNIVIIANLSSVPKVSSIDSHGIVFKKTNKKQNGVVGISLKYHDSRILFMSSSMISLKKMKERKNQYEKCFELQCGNPLLNIQNEYDYIFWIADFNTGMDVNTVNFFKNNPIIDTGKLITNKKESKLLSTLLKHDELSIFKNDRYTGFIEMPIKFLPSYPIDTFSRRLNKTLPSSYRSRILYKKKEEKKIKGVYYKTNKKIANSRHLIVEGLFEIHCLRTHNVIGHSMVDKLRLQFVKVKYICVGKGLKIVEPKVSIFSYFSNKLCIESKKKCGGGAKEVLFVEKDLSGSFNVGIHLDFLTHQYLYFTIRDGKVKKNAPFSNFVASGYLPLSELVKAFKGRRSYKFEFDGRNMIGKVVGKFSGELYLKK